MTSKWIRSAPAASTASTSSPSRAKSAERIDGAIQCSLFGSRAVVIRMRSSAPSYVGRAAGCHSTVQRPAQHERDRTSERESEQRMAIAAELGRARPDDAADDRGAEKLADANAEREQPLTGSAPLGPRLLQRDVPQRRAEQRRQPEPDRRARRIETRKVERQPRV